MCVDINVTDAEMNINSLRTCQRFAKYTEQRKNENMAKEWCLLIIFMSWAGCHIMCHTNLPACPPRW